MLTCQLERQGVVLNEALQLDERSWLLRINFAVQMFHVDAHHRNALSKMGLLVWTVQDKFRARTRKALMTFHSVGMLYEVIRRGLGGVKRRVSLNDVARCGGAEEDERLSGAKGTAKCRSLVFPAMTVKTHLLRVNEELLKKLLALGASGRAALRSK